MGVHKVYLGQGFRGVLYALFFWTLIPAVVGVIEGIGYYGMSDEEWSSRYGSVPPTSRFGAGLLIGCAVCIVLVLVATFLADIYLSQ